jgi:cytochrome P450
MYVNSHTFTRFGRKFPPSPCLPVVCQTLCCRWLPAAYLKWCHSRLGDRFTVYTVDMPPLVFLANPDDIKAVLSGDPCDLHPGAGAMTIAPLIGERSFMLLEEDEHIHARRSITPSFHRRMTSYHASLLADTVEREVARWPLNVAAPLDSQIRALTLEVILRAIFGDIGDELEILHEKLMKMLAVTLSVVLQEPKVRHVPGWRGAWRAFLAHRAEVDRLIYNFIRQRRAEPAPGGRHLLDMLLAAETAGESPMSDREVRDNVMSMILAGHETTTGELAWAFQLLAHHPHVQDRLAEEIDSGTEDAYLTATIHETMRHKPVFLFAIPRKVVKPIEIRGWTYDPPAHLVACTYLMHHDPELYPQPHVFRPERFLDKDPDPRTWLPWGGGRKHCLGRHFALLETKTIMREVLATRTVLPASSRIEHPRWRSAILVPHAGGRVVMRDRHRVASSGVV